MRDRPQLHQLLNAPEQSSIQNWRSRSEDLPGQNTHNSRLLEEVGGCPKIMFSTRFWRCSFSFFVRSLFSRSRPHPSPEPAAPGPQVALSQVVRSTQRIVAGARAFQLSAADAVKSSSLGTDGPPVKSFIFEVEGKEGNASRWENLAPRGSWECFFFNLFHAECGHLRNVRCLFMGF